MWYGSGTRGRNCAGFQTIDVDFQLLERKAEKGAIPSPFAIATVSNNPNAN